MSRSFEEQFADVLFHLESAIVEADRSSMGGLTDWHVRCAVESLIRLYGAEAREAPRPESTMTEEDQLAYDRLHQVAEWEMDRGGEPPQVFRRAIARPTPVTLDEIIHCLKRIKRSVDRWQKHAGRRGYLNFVGQYI